MAPVARRAARWQSSRRPEDLAAAAAAIVSDGQRADQGGETMAKLKNLKERFVKEPASARSMRWRRRCSVPARQRS